MSLLPKHNIFRDLLRMAIVASLCAVVSQSTHAQTFSVIHTFSGIDGANPQAGVTIDARGRLYGTTSTGGIDRSGCEQGCGTVFRLTQQGQGWTLNPLWEFTGSATDGALPISRPVFGPNGLLYGTTNAGGDCGGVGCGTLYRLRPGATVCTSALCPWSETVLYSFGGDEASCLGFGEAQAGSPEHPGGLVVGSCPGPGDLTFDQAGNIYGTVQCCFGSVYKLTPSGTPSVLYDFAGRNDGALPQSGVIFDHAGNLYGTTQDGGSAGCGSVYELSPNGSGWTETILYSFKCWLDGQWPIGGLIFDDAGNLYGTTNFGGVNNGGTVFELTPSGGGNWTYQLLYSLVYDGTFDFLFYGPAGSLAMDSSGNLYGTTVMDGAFAGGSVFKLTPHNGSWTYTSLHDFSGGSDGGQLYGNVVFDATGNIYGTASVGPFGEGCGGLGCGVVWEITP